ncbi:MAG: hypothetical protein V4585_05905 [Bacteroidota bacterium]
MKKFIVILLVIFANNLSFSQIQKSSWLLGGSINLNNNNFKLNSNNFSESNSSTSSIFNVIPEINYVISNKFMIGGGLNYSSSTSNSENVLSPQSSVTLTSYNIKNESISGFLQAKYYVNVSKNIWWNVILKSGFGKITYTYNAIPKSLNATTTTLSIGQNPALEPTYFYSNLNSQILIIPFQRFGFQLDIGGLSFLKYNYDKIVNVDIVSNNISFNVNPSNWSLGIFYVLRK